MARKPIRLLLVLISLGACSEEHRRSDSSSSALVVSSSMRLSNGDCLNLKRLPKGWSIVPHRENSTLSNLLDIAVPVFELGIDPAPSLVTNPENDAIPHGRFHIFLSGWSTPPQSAGFSWPIAEPAQVRRDLADGTFQSIRPSPPGRLKRYVLAGAQASSDEPPVRYDVDDQQRTQCKESWDDVLCRVISKDGRYSYAFRGEETPATELSNALDHIDRVLEATRDQCPHTSNGHPMG